MALVSIYTDVLPRVSPYLNGCEEPVQRQAIRDAGIQFLDETEIWRENVEKYTVEGQQEYDLLSNYHQADINQDREIDVGGIAAYEAAYLSQGDWPVPPAPIPEDFFNNAQSIFSGGGLYEYDGSKGQLPEQWVPVTTVNEYNVYVKRVRYLYKGDSNCAEHQDTYRVRPDGVVRFTDPHELSNQKLVFSVVYVPNNSTEQYQDWILERYSQAIAHMALYKLYSMPRRPWSDLQAADWRLQEYNKEAMTAMSNREAEYNSADFFYDNVPFV